MAQLGRLIIIFARPIDSVRRDARVRVGLAEGEEVDPRLKRADVISEQSFPIGPKPCANTRRPLADSHAVCGDCLLSISAVAGSSKGQSRGVLTR